MDKKTLCSLVLLNSGCYNKNLVSNLPEIDPKKKFIIDFFELTEPYCNPIIVGTDQPGMYPGTLEMINPLEHEDHTAIVWDYSRKFNGERRTAKFYTEQSGEPIHFILTNHSLKVKDEGYTCIEKYIDAQIATDEYGVTREVRPDGVPDYISLTMGCVNVFGFSNTMEVINNQDNVYTGGQYVVKDDLSLEVRDFFTNVFMGHVKAEVMHINGKKYQPEEGQHSYTVE